MKQHTIGFVGGGRITRLMLEGWKRQGALLSTIVVSDPQPTAVATTTDNRAAAGQDIVFVAVHPPVLAETVAGLKDVIKPDALVVSLAPKFTIAKLAGLLGGFDRIARVIPNAPSLIGRGFNPAAFGSSLADADRNILTGLMTPLGECPMVSEEKLEAYAILSAMGPTYFWFQMQALREVATGCGLTDDEINPALKRMICGAAQTLCDAGLTAQEVMDLIPVKPLGEDEAAIRLLYMTKLPALHAKIKP
jgi:pyrroline-5-carboxylate reductase